MVYITEPYIRDELTPKAVTVLLYGPASSDRHATFIEVANGRLEYRQLPMKKFLKQHIGLVEGKNVPTEKVAKELLLAAKKYSEAAVAAIEETLKMDTRGKSSEQIRQEVARLAEGLPEGHAMRDVPKQYPDRGTAIAAYTAVRQALFALKGKSTTTQESTMSKKVKAGEKQTETQAQSTEAAAKADDKKATAAKPKATKEAKELASKKGSTKPKADFSGNYVLSGEAAKVKSAEELGMHEASVRTKVIAAIFGSKAKNGVPYAKLEEVAGDKTRGAIAYLVKRKFIERVAA